MAQLKDLIVTGDTRLIGNVYNNSGMVAVGTCATAAATAAKVITISDTSWTLKVGDVIGVKYTYTNTASSVTLNVNGSGAKQIWYNTAAYTGTSTMITGYANRYVYYMYDGTYWVWMHDDTEYNDNTYTCGMTWTTSAAIYVTHNNYHLHAGDYDLVTFVYANNTASALTMNINGKGAKPLYLNGSITSATNYGIPVGVYLVYYDGTNYYMRTDGKIPAAVTSTGDSAATVPTVYTGSIEPTADIGLSGDIYIQKS